MPKVLTARFVKAASPPKSGRAEYPDAMLPGFRLRVTVDGKRSFSLRYRSPADRKQRRLTWPYPAFTLSEAHEEAREALRAIGRGEDPATEKQAQTTSAELPGTVDALCDLYIEQYLKKNVHRWKAARGEIDNHVRPHLGSLSLTEINRGHVRQMLAAIEPRHPVAANRALQRLRAVFNWAIEQDLMGANPTLGIKKPTQERPVSRILTDDELAAVWRACNSLQYPAREYMQILFLTGQRRDDVRLMHWSEIDLAMRTWVIPDARYKNRRSHLVPLTDATVEMLLAMPFRDREDYVFSSTEGEKPYANLARPKRELDKASGVTGWTLHDIRRTFRTGLSRLGIRPDIAERVIGHSVGGRLGETYDVYNYRAEKLVALEAWGAHVEQVLSGRKRGNVVALQAEAR